MIDASIVLLGLAIIVLAITQGLHIRRIFKLENRLETLTMEREHRDLTSNQEKARRRKGVPGY